MAREYRVLLIAMSGVRVHDQELAALGMSLPGFIERGKVIASLPSLSLLTLASYCPPHWIPSYREVDAIDTENLLNEASNFDLVALSTYTARAYDTYALADQLRANGIAVVLGGLHVSAVPEEAARHADCIVVGQGESVWQRVLSDFEHDRLQKVYDSRLGIPFNIETARTPRFDLIDVGNYNRITLQCSRGCPLNCHFCAASRTISSYQLKPISKIRMELEAILQIWERPFLELADDNTFAQKRWAKELLRLFGQYPLKWFTETDISVADDEELLDLLALSNCAQILIGFESAIPQSLSGIECHDWKRRQFDTYLEKIARIQRHGISVNGCFILGLDSDDRNTFALTQQFIESSALSEVQITILTPFPGTSLFRRLKSEGRLLKESFWDECTLFDVTFRPARMEPEELREGFFKLMKSLYSEEQSQARKRKFKQCRRDRRNALPATRRTP